MIGPIKTLTTWPRRPNNEPIFETSDEAMIFAHLIWKDEDEQRMLPIYHKDCREELTHERHKKEPDLDRMYIIAVRAQFFRECLDECQRIKAENSQG